MRAYAIVRKPQPGLHQHVIKVTKEEPKISIDPISENRLASPHKTDANNVHELPKSGVFFRLSSQQQDSSSHKSTHQQPIQLELENESQQEREKTEVVLPPEEPSKVARTKRLFQEFPVSPSKLKQEEPKEEKLNATPVRLLQPDPEALVLPVDSILQHPPKKPRIFDRSESPRVKGNDIVYESDSKNVFCCGEVSSDQVNQLPPPMIFTKQQPRQPETREKHDSSKKRRIFEDFEEQHHMVEEFTFKDNRVSNRNLTASNHQQPPETTLRIKIFEFAPIPAFDI